MATRLPPGRLAEVVALATLCIFLPSFLFVAVTFPLVPRLRSSSLAGGFLDGINVASLGLMGAVTWHWAALRLQTCRPS